MSSLGSDHKHIPDYSLCCHLNPDSFLLRYMCPVLANSHVYKYVYTCAIHKQSITVTTIAISYFSALCFNSCPDFLVDGLCCRSPKGKVI